MMQKRYELTHGQKKTTDLTQEERQALIAPLLQSADKLIHAGEYKQALSKISEVYRIDPQNFYAKAYSDKVEQLMSQQQKQAAAFFAATPSPPAEGTSPVPVEPATHGAFFMYRELMKEVWFDGKVTPEEEQELKHVRDLFNISNKEHFEIEHEVKIEAYLEALRLAWRDGVLTQNERQVLELMRQKYGITTDEHRAAESKVQEAKKGMPARATVLIVDTDNDHRTKLATFLKDRNYDILSANSVESAFRLIVGRFPQVVLTEIMFTSSQQDGFSLFNKLRAHPTLQNVPIFFMSKVKDEKVIRAGLRMGLDLYFPKPVDRELLLAAIDGRLRGR
jgi:CheY-like chemotaxis protein